MKRTFLFIALFFNCWIAFSQGEANNWYFGQNAAITFNGGSPVGLTNSAMVSFEGCSTISDSNGNLLFYSDGISVWNRNHQVMPNGTGLLGNPSSTQSGIIVPHPGNSDLYYLFSLDEKGFPNGLRYSVIDISLDNGLGDVNSSKNILLHTPSTEKITAITHANGNDIWVVTHKYRTNEFFTYLIDNTGINSTPIITSIGFRPVTTPDAIGSIKISPDGSKLAIAYGNEGLVEIFDFDTSTGLPSNLIQIPGFRTSVFPTFIYGVEFSPNSDYLYIGQTSDAVFQFDISNFSQTAIVNSKTRINPTPFPPSNIVDPYTSLQLGPDGKIYVAQFDYNYLGVINNPNLAGNACDYQLNGVFLSTGVCQYGLPPFIASYFSSNITADNTCLGDLTNFSISSNQTIDSISWDFGDGNNSNLENPSHTYATTGSYNVVVTISSGGEVFTNNRTVEIFEQPTASTPQNIEICDANNDGFHNFDLTQQDAAILNGQSANTFEVVYFENLTDYNNDSPILNPSAFANNAAYGTQTIIASVRNIGNDECEAMTTFDIQVFESPLPSRSVPAIRQCDNNSIGSDTDGLILFDLTTNETVVLDGQPLTDFELAYFTDAALTMPVANPASYQNSNRSETIYVQMVNTLNSNCSASTNFDIQVLELPSINPVVQLNQCDDDTDGVSTFNLNEVVNEITPNNTYSTTFHTNLSDAENELNEITNTAAYQNTTSNAQTILARVENTEGCYRTSQVDLVVSTTQIPATFLRTIYQCDDGADLYDGIATFDLTASQMEITNLFPAGQTIDVQFYRDETDALSEVNEITNITSYENLGFLNTQDIYVRVDDSNNDCIGLGHHVTLVVERNPLTLSPIIIEQCDISNNGTESIDTSTINAQILRGQTDVDIIFRNGSGTLLSNPLPNPLVTGSQSISVEMINRNSQDSDGSCSTFSSIDITIDAGVVANPIANQQECDTDNDGLFAFDTSSIQSALLGAQTGVTVTYEDQNGNLLSSPLPNPFNSGSQTITATVINPTNSFCFAQTNIEFVVDSTPVANTVMDDIVCDDSSNDGEHLYDLSAFDNQVLNGQSATTFVITYYATQNQADLGQSSLANSYLSTSRSETIYARIENRNNPDCVDTIFFQIGVSRLPVANTTQNLSSCDDSSNDGFETFDLSLQESSILNGQSLVDNIITFHLSQNDAAQGENVIATSFTNNTNPQTIYVRVENLMNENCFAITSFDIQVYEQPVLLMQENWTICENDSVELVADSGYDNYLWSTGETTESIIVTAPGNYDVTVSNDYGVITCPETKDLTVIESTIAVISNIEIEDWSQDNNSVFVEVQGTGDYEYSLDNVNYQDDNRFDNLPFGDYQIYVRDKNGCGVAEEDIYLLFYPRYFTPNGDGYHDYWQLYNSEHEPENKIYIFDRYGKLMKQISPEGPGWDGTFNNVALPSSDYWFLIERANGKTHRGHFTLKR